MPNLITAGGASDPLAITAASDGALTFQTGPSGAKVNALAFASDGTPTFLKARGGVAQIQTTVSSAVATGTALIPADDTIPQITEGDQYLTQAITPINASSLLEIDVVLVLSSNSTGRMAVALFQDATANALAVVGSFIGSTGTEFTIPLKFFVTAGTTSATTFRVRAGMQNAGTTTLNGATGARTYGGVLQSRITIKEYLP